MQRWKTRLTLGEHSLLAGELGDLVARHPLRERLRAFHSLHAAEAICAEDPLDIANLVARLVDRSLVLVAGTPDGPRYRLLESVAAYAHQRLHQAGELTQTRLRHRRYYADLAQRATPLLRGHDQRRWLRHLDAEIANLHACLDTAIHDDDPATALQMVNALTWYWFLRGRLQEARRALAAALALDHGGAAARAAATAWQSGFSVLAGKHDELATAARCLGSIADPAVRATVEWFLGFVASDFGDPSPGEAMVSRALAGFRAVDDQWGIAAALSTRAKQAMIRGDRAAARRDARDSLETFRALGDRWGQLQAIEWLGAAEAAAGDHAQAARLRVEAVRMAEELGLWPQAADALSWLGRSALQSGDLPQARKLLERAMQLATEQSYKPGRLFAEQGLGQTARREGQLDLAEAHLRNVLQQSWPSSSEPDVARVVCLSELALIAEERGDQAAARSLHQECLAAARKLGDPVAVAQALTGPVGAQALASSVRRLVNVSA